MLYIIEGADGTGKTVLARKLGKLLDCPVVHHGPTKSLKTDDEYMDFIGNVISLSPACDIVLDRFLASEFVYSAAYGRLPRCSRDFYNAVFAEFEAVTIFCDPGNEAILNNFDKQLHDSHDTQAGVSRAQELYRILFSKLVGFIITYDYTQVTAEQLLTTIKTIKPNKRKQKTFGEEIIDGLEQLGKALNKEPKNG